MNVFERIYEMVISSILEPLNNALKAKDNNILETVLEFGNGTVTLYQVISFIVVSLFFIYILVLLYRGIRSIFRVVF